MITVIAIRFGDMKKQLAEDIKVYCPNKAKSQFDFGHENYLKNNEERADKAQKSANASMELVRQAMGLKTSNFPLLLKNKIFFWRRIFTFIQIRSSAKAKKPKHIRSSW